LSQAAIRGLWPNFRGPSLNETEPDRRYKLAHCRLKGYRSVENQRHNREKGAAMKLLRIIVPAGCLALSAFGGIRGPVIGSKLVSLSPSAGVEGVGADDKLIYADFEKVVDNRPVSARGGYIKLYTNEQNPSKVCRVKGAAGDSDVPELVRLSK